MIFSGKTLEDALLNAERDTGKSRDLFKYNVISEINTIFKHEVKIEVLSFLTNGKIGIQDGKIVYEKGDVLPEIEPGENVIIRIGGKIVTKRTQVNESDLIELETPEKMSERKIELEITDNNMSAYIITEYRDNVKYKILDKDMDTNIVVDAEIIEKKPPEKFNREDVEKILNDSKIKRGINWQNLNKVIDGGKTLIAKGLEPIPTKDDNIKYFFNIEKFKKPIEVDGKVDYYNMGEVEFVEKGSILAIKEDGKDGQRGYDIFGNPINPAPQKMKKLFAGPGCELQENSTRIVATIQGNPSLKGETICVFPSHTVNTDVDIKSGNIDFNGDVIINGDIKEGMKVRAGNELIISGNVADSTIVSGGNIKIGKNIISSTVRAGEREFNDEQSLDYLKSLKNLLDIMIQDYDILVKSGKMQPGIDPGIVLRVLLQSKLQKQKEKVNEGITYMKKNNIKKDILEAWDKAVQIIQIIENGSAHNISLVININEMIDSFISQFKVTITPANALFGYAQNSAVYATNNVEVKGKGCYNTNIVAENMVIVEGQPGVFRGGKIVSVKGVKLKEVGSAAGVLTSIKTSKEAIVEADIVYQNTLITIGDQMYKFENPARKVKAYINKGELIVEKLKL